MRRVPTSTAEEDDLPDATGFAGSACSVDRLESGTVPGIVRGTYRPAEDQSPNTVRVLVDTEGVEGLIDTDSSRVEVL